LPVPVEVVLYITSVALLTLGNLIALINYAVSAQLIAVAKVAAEVELQSAFRIWDANGTWILIATIMIALGEIIRLISKKIYAKNLIAFLLIGGGLLAHIKAYGGLQLDMILISGYVKYLDVLISILITGALELFNIIIIISNFLSERANNRKT